MLSYLHSFHAGNHADVLKHTVLIEVLSYFKNKNKPCTFFDTHAGAGLYDIKSGDALKTGEASNGIEKLIAAQKNCPKELLTYIDFAQTCLAKGFYPGSPYIEANFLPSGSKLILSELHPKEIVLLKKNLKQYECNIHFRDGFEMLNALVPPKIQRGCVLLDPSYEEISDYENVANSVISAASKWNAGVILVWYPLLKYRLEIIEKMKTNIFEGIKALNKNIEICCFELQTASKDSHIETSLKESIGSKTPRMYGSGVLVINPVWKLEENMNKILLFLREVYL